MALSKSNLGFQYTETAPKTRLPKLKTSMGI